jgi:hypothetical protein
MGGLARAKTHGGMWRGGVGRTGFGGLTMRGRKNRLLARFSTYLRPPKMVNVHIEYCGAW